MRRSEYILVTDKDGARGAIEMPSQALNTGAAQVPVKLESGEQVVVPTGALEKLRDGNLYLPFSFTELNRQSTTATAQRIDTASAQRADENFVVPVMAEELHVDKRKVESGRVRITKLVREREETVDEALLGEEVTVERVQINREVDGPVAVRYEGDTMIIPLLEEVVVVEKRLVLKEELHVTKRQVEKRAPQIVPLRSEEVMVERINNQAQPESTSK